ncbi:hypothetical protein AB4Z29_17270 [Paenibacillus sp. 2TAB23]|uniref:hypothetical protein n=1 Tax=Paenibacillus sp. 2TAB23 TaxID=3233004 RepID=UPI003F9AB212
MRRRLILISCLLIAVAAISMFLLRVSVDKVTVQRMITFQEAEPNSQVVWKDRETIRAFEYAFRFGKKQPGMADVAFPPYAVTLGNRQYFLWVSDDYEVGTFMKQGDTGTLYKLQKSSSAKLQSILAQAYSVSGNASAAESEAERSMDLSILEDMELQDLPYESPSPTGGAYAPAYLDSVSYADDERPIIELINLRIGFMHDSNWDELMKLYTESAREARQGAGSFNGFTVTSIRIEGGISIKEQKSLFEATVHTMQSRDGGDPSSTFYVFHRGKEQGAVWRIADVD